MWNAAPMFPKEEPVNIRNSLFLELKARSLSFPVMLSLTLASLETFFFFFFASCFLPSVHDHGYNSIII